MTPAPLTDQERSRAASLLDVLYRVARSMAADCDLTHDAFFGLVDSLRRFDPSRGVPVEGFVACHVRWDVKEGLRERRRRAATRRTMQFPAELTGIQCPRSAEGFRRVDDMDQLAAAARAGLLPKCRWCGLPCSPDSIVYCDAHLTRSRELRRRSKARSPGSGWDRQ